MTIRRGIKYAFVGMAGLLALAILLTAGFAIYNRWNFPAHIYPGAAPDSYDDILVLARRGEAEKALNAVQDIKFDVHGSVREPAMRDVIGILAERGQIREVRDFAAQLRDKIEGNSYLLELAETQAKVGDIDGALESISFVIGGHDIRVGLGRVAVVIAHLGDFNRALNVARSIEPAKSRIYALNSIGLILANTGDPIAGRKIIEESLALAQSIPSEKSRRWPIAETAIAFGKLGDWAYAAALAATLDPGEQGGYALAELAQIQFKAGALAGAHETAQKIANIHYRNRAVENIMQSQLEIGDLAGAFETATIIPPGAERDEFLSGIAIYFPYIYRTGETKLGVVNTALAVANAIEGYVPRDSAYLCISSYAASEIDMIASIRIILSIEDVKMRKSALASSYRSLLYGYSLCTPIS